MPPVCGETWIPDGSARASGEITFTLTGSTDNVALDPENNYSCTVSTNGQTCNFEIKDTAGNTTPCTSPVAKIDREAPSCNSLEIETS